MIFRTHLCGTLSQADKDTEVVLAGWVDVRRDLGGVVFIELRDHTGRLQLVADPQINPDVHKVFETLKSEYCIKIKGKIRNRPDGTENPELRTGAVEIYPDQVSVLNKSKPLPIPLKDFPQADEAFRLRYRYLDLRRDEMQKNLRLRHKVTQAIREYLSKDGFLEIETPILTRSTPEGARDYLVPSRLQPGKFFALPQSPQLFKQLLMMSGFEKYYQIARCFRDEDLRADRQPEFTQVDIEQSFTDPDKIMEMMEGLLEKAFAAAGKEIKRPFRRMDYKDAMNFYGSDKPDLRFGMELINFTDLMAKSNFESFANITKKGGLVKGLCVPTEGWSRKEFDDLRNLAMSPEYGAKGLAWITYKSDGEISSPISKFFSEAELAEIKGLAKAENGSSVFFVADRSDIVHQVLGRLRLHLGNKLGLIDEEKDELLWVENWPLFHKDPETGALEPMHHPFTSVNPKDSHLLQIDPASAKALAYDVVYNGVELGGGSIRNHSEEAQIEFFKFLGMNEAEMKEKFGFLLEALSLGAPPHGGIALGLDRLIMMLAKAPSLRQVIAFPKVQSSSCPLTEAPAQVSEDQLEELSIRVKLQQKN